MKSPWVERLIEIREKKGLSGEAFGRPMGYSKAQISKLEAGLQKQPTREFLDALERAHHVNRIWLVEGTGSPVVSHATFSEHSASRMEDSGGAGYRTVAAPLAELLRALESASFASTVAGRTDFSRVLLDMIDQIQHARKGTGNSENPESARTDGS